MRISVYTPEAKKKKKNDIKLMNQQIQKLKEMKHFWKYKMPN